MSNCLNKKKNQRTNWMCVITIKQELNSNAFHYVLLAVFKRNVPRKLYVQFSIIHMPFIPDSMKN